MVQVNFESSVENEADDLDRVAFEVEFDVREETYEKLQCAHGHFAEQGLLGDAAIERVLQREDQRHAADPDEQRKDHVGERETVPRRMLEQSVATTAVVDEDHRDQC